MTAEITSVSVHSLTPSDIELDYLDGTDSYCLNIGPLDLFFDNLPLITAISDRIRELAEAAA